MSCAAPPECRIVAALLLQPMSVAQLAKALHLRLAYARQRVDYLRIDGSVHLQGTITGKGKPAGCYRLTRKGELWARAVTT